MTSLDEALAKFPHFIMEFPLEEGGENLKKGEYRLPRKADVYQSLTFFADQSFTAKIILSSRDIPYQEWFFPGEAHGWNRMTVNVNIPIFLLMLESWKIKVETAPDNRIHIIARGKVFSNIDDFKDIRKYQHEWTTIIGQRKVCITRGEVYPKYANGKMPDEYCITNERNEIYSLYPINCAYFDVDSILNVRELKEETNQIWKIDLPKRGICREVTLELSDNQPITVELFYNEKVWQKWVTFHTLDQKSKIILPLDAPLFLSQQWRLSITNGNCNKDLPTNLKVTAKIRIYEKEFPKVDGRVITIAQRNLYL